MGQAIGLAIIIVVFAIFLPDVLGALEELMLISLHKATEVIQSADTTPFTLQ
ncbi:MAG: hypothetical protein WD850_01535 [Candidatus Spechtbacterales bacterium]